MQHSSAHLASASSEWRYSPVAAVTASGGCRPFLCHSRQPAIIHARMPGHSALRHSASVPSRSLVGCSRKGDQVEPSSDCFVDGSQSWFMIAGNCQLELRRELEKVLSHEASRDRVATCQCFDAAFRPAPAFLGFDRGHEPCAAKHGKLGRMPIARRRCKSLEIGAVRWYSAKIPARVQRKTLFPFAPVPNRKNSACSRVTPVKL